MCELTAGDVIIGTTIAACIVVITLGILATVALIQSGHYIRGLSLAFVGLAVIFTLTGLAARRMDGGGD